MLFKHLHQKQSSEPGQEPEARSAPKPKGFTPVELLGILGFGLGIAWMLVVCFWTFHDFPLGSTSITRDFVQLFVFIGIACGYIALSILGRRPAFDPFRWPMMIVVLIAGLLVPVCLLLQLQGVALPLPAACLAALVSGLVYPHLSITWLDICRLLKTRLYGRFIGMSFLVGCLLYLLAVSCGTPLDVVLAVAYLAVSLALLAFANRSSEIIRPSIPRDTVSQKWDTSREVGSSFFMFCVVFGMAFNWLFNADATTIAAGLLSMVPAALGIAALSWLNIRVEVTLVVRILLCLCVFACVFMSQVPPAGKTVCSCLIIFAWTMLTSLSYMFAIKKSVVMHDAPFFRQAPPRFVGLSSGFAVGWGIICVGAQLFGDGSDALVAISLTVAVLLVAVFVFFFPQQVHYSMDGDAEVTADNPLGLPPSELAELRMRCVAKAHRLSPREIDVFSRLVRGSSAAVIQKELVISFSTVKTHIYNIYRKLSVHSQQELIEKVEAYEVQPADYELLD